VEAFLSTLFLPDAIQRRRALEEMELAGRRLPNAVFREVCEVAKQAEMRSLLTDPDWLYDLDTLLSPQQFADFYRETGLLKLLAEEAP
jgi:hypothetical protein